MDVSLDAITVRNNEEAQRYEAEVAGQLAITQYQRAGDSIIFTHTEVPAALEGHGIAAKLARMALDDAAAHGLTVVPLCPYVASYIRRHQEYLPLVDPAYRQKLTRG
jgi:predicted GNAT family acetyltransferase